MKRTLTVSALLRDTIRPYSPPRRIPHLRLTGDWLAAAGFHSGSRIIVHVHAGQLIITPLQ